MTAISARKGSLQWLFFSSPAEASKQVENVSLNSLLITLLFRGSDIDVYRKIDNDFTILNLHQIAHNIRLYHAM